MRTARDHRRQAFTLIELLVVIAIIGILAALAAAGIFQVVESSRQSTTDSGLRTIDKWVKKHWKAVVDDAMKKGTVPPKIVALAGGDPKRARVIWATLKLKQAFPMTFAEAREPYKNYAGGYVYLDPPTNTVKLLDANDLPSLYPSLPATTGLTPLQQSATCLLQALQISRGGISTSADELGPFARDIDGDGFKELVDGWGNPVAFFRWATALDELDVTNPATGSSAGVKFRNPLDPEGKLTNVNWNNPAGYGPPGPIYFFEQLGHQIHLGAGPTYSPLSRYTVPVLASAGRNGKFGLRADMNASNLNTDMTSDPAASQSDRDDNIYSFRLKVDQRGE